MSSIRFSRTIILRHHNRESWRGRWRSIFLQFQQRFTGVRIEFLNLVQNRLFQLRLTRNRGDVKRIAVLLPVTLIEPRQQRHNFVAWVARGKFLLLILHRPRRTCVSRLRLIDLLCEVVRCLLVRFPVRRDDAEQREGAHQSEDELFTVSDEELFPVDSWFFHGTLS